MDEMILLRNIVLLVILVIITYTDFKRREIDNEPLVVGLMFIVIFSICGYNNIPFSSSIIGFLVGGITFFILAYWGMGGGDVKLMAVIGFFLGWKLTILTMFFAFLIGSLMGILYIVISKKKVKDYIPFGPAIATATVIVMFFGETIICNSGWFCLLK